MNSHSFIPTQGQHYHFAEQVDHFADTVQKITRMFKGNTTKVFDHLSKCIYFAGLGSNDYLNNYFMPNMYPSSYEYSPKAYAANLLDTYSRQLTVSIIISFQLHQIYVDAS